MAAKQMVYPSHMLSSTRSYSKIHDDIPQHSREVLWLILNVKNMHWEPAYYLRGGETNGVSVAYAVRLSIRWTVESSNLSSIPLEDETFCVVLAPAGDKPGANCGMRLL
jgi:hypothetical protein